MKKLFPVIFCLVPFLLNAQVPGSLCAAAKIASYQRSYANVVDSSQSTLEERYDNHFLKLDLAVSTLSLAISGSATIVATATQPLDTFALELDAGYTIDSVFENGIANNSINRFGTDGNDLDIILSQTYAINSQVTLQIYYHGTRQSGGSESGFYGVNSGADLITGTRCTFTLSDPYAARQWWPAKQALYDKFDSTEVDITTDSFNRAGSNGLLVSIDSVAPGPGMVRYTWKNSYPIDYYLVFFSVARYVEYDYYAHPPAYLPGGDSVFVQNYLYDSSTLVSGKNIIDSVGLFLDSFSVRYGPYPYPLAKFGEIMSPFGGGMEDQTMTDICCLSYYDLAHELTHQWFGDLVTNRSFQDTWLNEGFAVYGQYLAQEIFFPQYRKAYMDSIHSATGTAPDFTFPGALTDPGGSVYVTDTTDFDSIFNLTLTYCKGASVVHMLRYMVNNDSLFWAAERYYLQKHAYSVSQTDSLRNAFEQFTGIDFTDFFNQWVYGQGYPTFNVTWNQSNDTLYVQDSESVSAPGATPVFTLPIEYTIQRNTGGDTTIRVMQRAQVGQFKLLLPAGTATGIEVDTFGWLLAKNMVSNDPGLSFPGYLLGVDNIKEPSIHLYPNPAGNVLWVNLDGLQGNTQAQIFGVDGKLWDENMVANGNNRFDISMLPGGVYFVRFTNTTESKALRFVKE